MFLNLLFKTSYSFRREAVCQNSGGVSGANGYAPVANEAISVAGEALLVVDEAVLAAGKTVLQETCIFFVADYTVPAVGEAVPEGDGYFPVNSKEVLVVF